VVEPRDLPRAAPPPEIKSRPWPRNGTWNQCRFPDLAKKAGFDDAHVTVVVHVTANGRPLSVDVLFESPAGYGVAEEARRCAMRRRYHPGKDASGQRVATSTDPIQFRMLRKK
jgi:hypothetical protein